MAHQIYYNNEGKEIPSVTQILKILDKSGIIEWANLLGFYKIKYKPFLNEKALIGTYVHERIERFFKNEDPLKGEMILDDSILKKVNIIFNRFIKWQKESKAIPIKIEESYNNNRYGGTLDCIISVDNIYTLVDFKTGKKPYSIYFLQLGAYLNLLKELDSDLYNKISFVQIISLGNGIIVETKTIDNMIKYQKAFDLVYNIYTTWSDILLEDWGESIE